MTADDLLCRQCEMFSFLEGDDDDSGWCNEFCIFLAYDAKMPDGCIPGDE